MKLTPRLIILFLVLAVFPTVSVGYFSYENGRRIIKQETVQHLVSINLLKSSDMLRWIEGNKTSLEELSQRPLLKLYADVMATHETSNPQYNHSHEQLISQHLLPRLKYGGFFELFVICPRHGIILASTDERQEGKYRENQSYFREGKYRTFVEGIYYSPALDQPAMTIGTPIKGEDGNLIAVLAGRVDLAELSGIMALQSLDSRTEDTYLVNHFNFFITEPRFGKGYALKKAVRTWGVKTGLSGRDGVGFYRDYRGVPVIGAFKWLPEYKACLISEVDQAEAYGPVVRLAWIIAGTTFFIAMAAGILAVLFARRITRPVQELVIGAEQIGRGNLGVAVGTDAKDEIGELSRAFDRMSERLKATTVSRDEFLRERDFSDYVINSLPGVFYLFDTEGVFIRWNKNFEKITGYSADEIRKIKPFDLFEGEDRRLVAERIQDVFISGEASVEALFVSKNGSRTPYYFTGFRVIIEAKQFLIGVGIDISEKKKAEKEILEAQAELRRLLDAAEQSRMELARIVEEQKRTEKEIQRLNLELEDRVRARTAQLQAVNQELEAFAYSVSHDLRAPLRALDGFSAALYSSYSEKLDNQAKHYLERIKAASHRMGELINDLLNLSRITRCQMNFTEVDLSRLATKIASELQDGNPERHVRFVIKQGMTVRGDLHLLRIMLENLMNNSWKFTGTRSDATIEVGMSVDAGERAFFVKDNGVGFDMAYADKLFSPFQRLHGVKEFPGTGIGLVTVKRIVTRHGGRIWGEGSPDQGATFYFTLEV